MQLRSLLWKNVKVKAGNPLQIFMCFFGPFFFWIINSKPSHGVDYRKYYECFEVFILLSTSRVLTQKSNKIYQLLQVFGVSRCNYIVSHLVVESIQALLVSLTILLINFVLSPLFHHYFFCSPDQQCPFFSVSGRIILLGISFISLNLAQTPFFNISYAAFATFRISSIVLVIILNLNFQNQDTAQIIVIAAILPLSWLLFYLADRLIPQNSDWTGCSCKRPPSFHYRVDKPSGFFSDVSSHDISIDEPREKEVLVVIQNLVKRYGSKTAVNKISLNLYKEEIVCILGTNGSGKSTLIEMLIGARQKSVGEIFINNYSISSQRSRFSNFFGYCPQTSTFIPELSVRNHLQLVCGIRNLPKQQNESEIKRVLTLLNLVEHQHKKPDQLSGGMKRKLSIAMSLIGDPPIIVLDEPSSGMDPENKEELWDMLRLLRSQGSLIVMITQIVEEAQLIADRVVIMCEGNIMKVGSVRRILQMHEQALHLSLLFKPITTINTKDEIVSLILRQFPWILLDFQGTASSASFLLPMKKSANFNNLFGFLNEIEEVSQVLCRSQKLEDSLVFSQILGMNRFHCDSTTRSTLYRESKIPRLLFPDSFFLHAKPTVWGQVAACFRLRLLQFTRQYVIHLLYILDLGYYLYLFHIGWFNPANFVRMFQAIGIYFVPIIIIEHQSGQSHLLQTAGASLFAYRAGSLAGDIFCWTMYSLPIYIVLFATSSESVKCNPAVLIMIFIFWIAVLIPTFQLIYYFFARPVSGMLSIWIVIAFLTFCMRSLPQIGFLIPSQVGWLSVYEQLKADPISSFIHGFDDYIYLVEIKYCFVIMASQFVLLFLALLLFDFLRQLHLFQRIKMCGLRNPSMTNESRAQNESSLIPRPRINTSLDSKPTLLQSTVAFPKQNNAIKMEQIAKFYNRRSAFIQVKEISISKNLSTALLGTNGAGKSTLLDLITHKKLLNFGSIAFQQKSLFGKVKASQSIGYVFQGNELWSSVTLIELLEIFARLRGLNSQQTYEQIFFLVQSLKLAKQLRTYTQNLSQGNRRRLQIALSLLGCPEFGILDQPTTGLDPFQKATFWSLMSYVNRVKQRTTLLTIQKEEEAILHCQHFLRLQGGRLAHSGEVKLHVTYVVELRAYLQIMEGKECQILELTELSEEIEERGEKARLYFSRGGFGEIWEIIGRLGEREKREVIIWYEFRSE